MTGRLRSAAEDGRWRADRRDPDSLGHARHFPALQDRVCSRGLKSPGLEQGSGDVVGEVAEAEGGSACVLEPSVDGLCRTFGCAGSLEAARTKLAAGRPDSLSMRFTTPEPFLLLRQAQPSPSSWPCATSTPPPIAIASLLRLSLGLRPVLRSRAHNPRTAPWFLTPDLRRQIPERRPVEENVPSTYSLDLALRTSGGGTARR